VAPNKYYNCSTNLLPNIHVLVAQLDSKTDFASILAEIIKAINRIETEHEMLCMPLIEF